LVIGTERPAWAQWISPETLAGQVLNTAPFLQARFPAPEPGRRLIDLGDSPEGFLRILANWRNIERAGLNAEEQLQDYFAICVACHHATVATFVPTDVDTKIRGIVWRATRDLDSVRAMLRLALAARVWTLDGISLRVVRGVSGHNGEQWSVIGGGLGWLLELGDNAGAEEAQAAIEAEIDREQAILEAAVNEPGAELDVLRLAMMIAHNRGDLKQGMGFWKRGPATAPVMDHLSARGRFDLAVRIYQETGMSAEGHRHYPLRGVRALRQSARWLLPISPFLDEWGALMTGIEESHEVLAGLIAGCQKVAGQQGYYRAIAGMQEASPGEFERTASRMPNAAQRALRGGELRQRISVPRGSFEAMMRKRARTVLSVKVHRV
jgi:hypothetical protein